MVHPPRLILLLLFVSYSFLFAQESTTSEPKEQVIRLVGNVQFWGVYTFGQQYFDTTAEAYQPMANGLNVQVRRARIGVKAQPYDRLKVAVITYFDQMGHDVNAGNRGGGNPGWGSETRNPNLGIWDAYFTWQVLPGAEWLNFSGGYFRPQLGRESITSAFAVGSMDKAPSQTYTRRHLTGRSSGRTTGFDIGGDVFLNEWLTLNYNLGLFTPGMSGGNNLGSPHRPLWVGRVVLYLGDPEQTHYKMGYGNNYFSRRNGLSIGVGGSHQGQTEAFFYSRAFSLDWLLNWGGINFDGEWTLLHRNGITSPVSSAIVTHQARVGHARLGYNIHLRKGLVLEPQVMGMMMNGVLSNQDQTEALALGLPAGNDRVIDAGLNLYIREQKLKLTLHYTWQQGNAGEAEPGFSGNDYYNISGLGPAKRGNWLGLGLSATY